MKKLFLLTVSFVLTPSLHAFWPFSNGNQTLINEINLLKKEIEHLKEEAVIGSLRHIDKDTHIETLENRVKQLEVALVTVLTTFNNTLKTFEVNINSQDFSQSLKELQSTLDTKESAKLLNEAMANALYRLKFMCVEARYLLNWSNNQLDWEALKKRGVRPPVFKDNFSKDQIKNMVMDVKTDE